MLLLNNWKLDNWYLLDNSRKVFDFASGVSSRHAFRARTTQVSNLLRSPSFRASASSKSQYPAFAFGVPHDINAFHYYTMSSRYPFLLQSSLVSRPDTRLSLAISDAT